MKTVLLWGDAWWVEGSAEPLPFENMTFAADVLARAFDRQRPKLRLIYQPDSLTAVPTRCPNTNRATLAAVLAERIPGLGDENAIWSHEPILRRHAEFETIVHQDLVAAALPSLQARLADLGFAIEAIWPFSTYLGFVPSEMTESGATTVVAVGLNRACAYHHGADGKREVRRWAGPEIRPQVAEWLGQVAGKVPGDAITLICRPDELEGIKTLLPQSVSQERLRGIELVEALGGPVVLPTGHPAQLLRVRPVMTWSHALLSVSLLLFATAAWSGVAAARDYTRWHEVGRSRMVQKHALVAEIAHLKANAAEIETLETSLASGHRSSHLGPLLRAIGDTIPREITLARLHADEREFTAEGFVAPASAGGTWDGWTTQLRSRCSFTQVRVQPSTQGAHSIEGTFTE